MEKPVETLFRISKERNLAIIEEAFARHLDEHDELSHLRKHFHTPRVSELLEESVDCEDLNKVTQGLSCCGAMVNKFFSSCH